MGPISEGRIKYKPFKRREPGIYPGNGRLGTVLPDQKSFGKRLARMKGGQVAKQCVMALI